MQKLFREYVYTMQEVWRGAVNEETKMNIIDELIDYIKSSGTTLVETDQWYDWSQELQGKLEKLRGTETEVWCVFAISTDDPAEPAYKDLDKIFFSKDDAEEYVREQQKNMEVRGIDEFKIEEWTVN